MPSIAEIRTILDAARQRRQQAQDHAPPGTEAQLCECASLDCTAVLYPPQGEVSARTLGDGVFLLADGHHLEGGDVTVTQRDGYRYARYANPPIH